MKKNKLVHVTAAIAGVTAWVWSGSSPEVAHAEAGEAVPALPVSGWSRAARLTSRPRDRSPWVPFRAPK